MRVVVYILIISLAFCSCTKDNFVKEVPYPEQKAEQLVIGSFISPTDEQIKVSVSLSRPAYGPGVGKMNMNARVRGAVVVISDDAGRSARIPQDNKAGQYMLEKSQFPIVTGKTYYLKVSAHGKSVSAKTSIPKAVENHKFELVKKNSWKDHGYGSTTINEYLYRFSVPSDGLVDGGYYSCYPIFDRSTEYTFSGKDKRINKDPAKIGKVFFRTYGRASNALPFDHLIMIENRTYADYGYNSSSKEIITHTGVFTSCSKEYYLFHKTAPNNIKTAENSGNPLVPPVSNVYSNIEGGYGIFAGYNEVKVSIPASHR